MRRGVSARVLSVAIALSSAGAAEMFPFVLPWDDATPSITNLSSWNDAPAGKSGFVSVKDGHLYAGEKRLKIFGVNMAFGANFPRKADAEKIAARMAKFGINCVRFHHMDMQAAPGGIWAEDMLTFDPEQLDRLDYFIAQLKAQGIYTDLNLHVSRTYPDRPKSEKAGTSNFDKGVDLFSPAMITLQQDYARDLLTHVNPYTKSAYSSEPAVALIEISNENALLDEWHNGGLDRAAEPYRAELGKLWTEWLWKKYKTDEKLAAAWKRGAREPGPELLKNGAFREATELWHLERHSTAVASAERTGDGLRVRVEKAGAERWHVQLVQSGLRLKAGEPYALIFRGRAAQPSSITVNASQAHEPYRQFASKSVSLSAAWQPFIFAFSASADDENARVVFTGLGGAPGEYEFADVSFRVAGVNGDAPSVESADAPAFTRDEFASHTPTARDDWMRFLWAVEERYWTDMYAFLREELKCRSLIVGTQLGWSPFPIQQRMDVIDSHAYWQHPHFPRRPWDATDWTVQNVSMAGAPDGGTLAPLALQRVAGKPYLCTEYNHAAPNEFAAETFPLVCAYAALQDWDGVFAFAYSHRADDWDKRYFPSFFDIDQHPTKMATLAASLAMFRRGDVAIAKGETFTPITRNEAILRSARSGPRLGAEQFGVPSLAAFVRRVGVRLGESDTVTATAISARRVMSDTTELVWDTQNRVVLVNTARSKLVVGAWHGRAFTLGDVRITPGEMQAWACVQATVFEGNDFASAKRILVTATGLTANTGMKWKDAAKTSVGSDWGKAPALVEGVAAALEVPNGARLKAWALDERGVRRAAVPLTGGTIRLNPEHRTLWYELATD